MVTRLVVIKDDDEISAEQWIHDADDSIIGCRGQGHAWPKLRTGRANSKYVKLETDGKDGCWQLIQICRDCKMERCVTTTSDTHEIDMPAKFKYRAPAGYKGPKGITISRRACFAESWRRRREDLTSLVSETA